MDRQRRRSRSRQRPPRHRDNPAGRDCCRLLADTRQSIRTLGRASYVVDAFTPGDIWLVVDPGFGGTLAADSGCTVEEVSLAGRVLVGSRSYPCDWTVDGPAPAGLLVTRASKPPALEKSPETLSIWDPASNWVEASYGYASPYLQLDGDSGNSVLWNECNSTPCAPDNFTDLATGRTVVLPKWPTAGMWTQATSWPRTAPSPLSSPSPMPRRPLSEANGSLQYSRVATPGSRRF